MSPPSSGVTPPGPGARQDPATSSDAANRQAGQECAHLGLGDPDRVAVIRPHRERSEHPALAAGLVAGVAFVRRQRRLADPLLDLTLFGNRSFRGALAITLVSLLTTGGVYLFVTQYLQLVAGLPPMEAGLWLLPPAAGLIVTSLTAPLLARRIRPGHVLAGAFAVCALGYLLMTQAGAGTAVLLAAFFLVYVGAGPVGALGTDLIVGAAPPEKTGAASALGETSSELGIALGVAILGSAGTAVYRESMNASGVLAVARGRRRRGGHRRLGASRRR
ncbi:hypothetical protein Misp01_08930 [Microtetraspora sp. NBRC 13810]|uniref:MFS transporter n=1 Tax=Microtetraspora sp. NBRC 13810 TaxID=3030990 RepID=UPI0024A5769D|nr:MFS transporter [Microtetraspora sp. NBRC 13810]GLW05763.1 hypothetical protein Misp01_08930 [Microtetraspora sp. NBRC 13810]